MKNRKASYGALVLAALLPLGTYFSAQKGDGVASGASTSLKPFLGRWDLTIKSPKRDLPSWIEVSAENGQPKILMVGVTDHATPLKQVEFKAGELVFVSPKGEEGFSEDTTIKAKVAGAQMSGTASSGSAAPWPLSGRRAPELKRTAAPKWGKPVTLFNGKDFTGWKFSDPAHKSVWKVEDGTLVKDGSGSEIVSIPKFMDFKLHVEFNCGTKSNSGVYLRGRYEVQIETDSADEPPNRQMGGIYGFFAANPESRTPDVWQMYDITLVGRTVTVQQNGKTTIDHQEIPGITGGALDSHEELPGPIYLQGSEEGRVAFRNVVITPAL